MASRGHDHQDTQDTQDNQFGKAAAEDQELVDRLDDDGVPVEALPDRTGPAPRAAGKAEPAE